MKFHFPVYKYIQVSGNFKLVSKESLVIRMDSLDAGYGTNTMDQRERDQKTHVYNSAKLNLVQVGGKCLL